MRPPSRRVLVTGASGLVGHAVAARLAKGGASVVSVGRGTDLPGAPVSLDLTRDAWPPGPWDVIVHCAARLPMRFDGPEAAAAIAENRLLDERALDSAAASGAHLVFFSSASVYGDTAGEIDGDTPTAPVLGYAREKLATEKAIAARGLAATVFRLVAPYGPRQVRKTVLLRFLDAALAGDPLRYFGTGGRTQDFLHVDDIAAAVACVALRRVLGCFVLASGVATRMRELAELVVKVTRSESPVEAAGVPDPEEGRSARYRVDSLRERAGFQPSLTLADGIASWAELRRRQGPR